MWWRIEVFSFDHNLPWNVPPWKISPRLPWRPGPGRSLLLPWAGSLVRAGSLQPPHCRGQPWTHPRQCAVCRVCVTCGVECGVWCVVWYESVGGHCQSASGQVAAAAGPVAPAAAPPRTTATTTWHQHQHHRATIYLTMLLSLGIGRSQIKLSFTINISKFSGMDMATYHN